MASILKQMQVELQFISTYDNTYLFRLKNKYIFAELSVHVFPQHIEVNWPATHQITFLCTPRQCS